MRFHIELSPAGGYRVMLRGHPVPVSLHDTEEDARARMRAYADGAARLAIPGVATAYEKAIGPKRPLASGP